MRCERALGEHVQQQQQNTHSKQNNNKTTICTTRPNTYLQLAEVQEEAVATVQFGHQIGSKIGEQGGVAN